MKTGTTAVLFALCSIAALSTSARADVDDGRHGANVVQYQMTGAGPRQSLRRAERRHVERRRHARRGEHRQVREERSIAREERRIVRHGRLAASARAMAALDSVGMPTRGQSKPWAGSSLVSEARRYIGGNPTGRSSLWCARFMNFVLKKAGYAGTSSDMASSFASYGHRISGPRVGAIAVMSRGRRGGHVGVVSGFDAKGNPIVISGNHSHRVAESTYSRSRIYAYVMP